MPLWLSAHYPTCVVSCCVHAASALINVQLLTSLPILVLAKKKKKVPQQTKAANFEGSYVLVLYFYFTSSVKILSSAFYSEIIYLWNWLKMEILLFQRPWGGPLAASIYISMWTPQSVTCTDCKGISNRTCVSDHDFPLQGAS